MRKIIHNANIYTMNADYPHAEAFMIEEERFVKVGTNEEILTLITNDCQVIDAKGKTIIPGFNDSHMHLYSFGLSLQMVALQNAQSISDLIVMTKQFIENQAIPKGTWVRGRGWNQDHFTDELRFPNRFDLDQITTDYPLVLSRACGHVLVVNTKALELCNIHSGTCQIEGGIFDCDSEGVPLGIFRENALNLILGNIPNPSLDEVKETLLKAIHMANSQGLTSIQTDDLAHLPDQNFKKMIAAYEELKKENKLTCRIYEQCLFQGKKEFEEFLHLGYHTGVGDDYFKIGPLKILSDGSLGARTAALSKPYHDDPSTKGILCFKEEELMEYINDAHQQGMQIAVHCIGDYAMKVVLDAYEQALSQTPRENHRHAIIHCQIMDEEILNRYKELHVLALVQPIFLHYDLHIVEDRVGKMLASTSYAFQSMIQKGIKIGLGTDCPVEALDPFPNIYCAVTRQDLTHKPLGGWFPKEKLTLSEALVHYTLGSAYASFEESIKGSIEEGKLADFICLSCNPYLISDNEVKDIKVVQTFVGGNEVYSMGQ